jgi:hypothetical protein
VAPVAPLTKRYVFNVLDDLAFATRVAILGGHSSVP